MVEALVLTMVVVAFGLAMAGFSLFAWLLLLPFRILGGLFKLGAALIALPLMLVFGLVVATLLGVGALFLFLPLVLVVALPIALFAWMLGWGHPRPTASRIVT